MDGRVVGSVSDVPQRIEPMRIAAKFAFSWKYKECGMLGALGLVDHGSWEPDMVRTCTMKGFDCGLDQWQGGGPRWPQRLMGER